MPSKESNDLTNIKNDKENRNLDCEIVTSLLIQSQNYKFSILFIDEKVKIVLFVLIKQSSVRSNEQRTASLFKFKS